MPEVKNIPAEVWEALRTRYAAGYGGFPLVGTADQIAGKLAMLSDAGLDGVLLTWIDFLEGAKAFNREVLPRLESLGLRKPLGPLANAAASRGLARA